MSFLNALKGFLTVVRHERHMRIHLCAAFYVVLAGFITQLPAAQWCAVLLCIGLVTALECLNTAVEQTCNAITEEYNLKIKLAKDAAAGGVLLAAVLAAAVGCVVFFSADRPRLALAFAARYPAISVIIVLTLIPWIYFIVLPDRQAGKQKIRRSK